MSHASLLLAACRAVPLLPPAYVAGMLLGAPLVCGAKRAGLRGTLGFFECMCSRVWSPPSPWVWPVRSYAEHVRRCCAATNARATTQCAHGQQARTSHVAFGACRHCLQLHMPRMAWVCGPTSVMLYATPIGSCIPGACAAADAKTSSCGFMRMMSAGAPVAAVKMP